MKKPSQLSLGAAILALLAGCSSTGEYGKSVNTVYTPSKYQTLAEGRYRKADQPLMVDCVNDAMAAPADNILLSHVRQTKRADGYRVDLVGAASQFMVAYIRDDGSFRLLKADYSNTVQFIREEALVKACLAKFREG